MRGILALHFRSQLWQSKIVYYGMQHQEGYSQ